MRGARTSCGASRSLEERDRALAALKELEFDHRAGGIGDEDYRELVGPLRQAVAAALRAIEQDRRTSPASDADRRRAAAARAADARAGAVPRPTRPPCRRSSRRRRRKRPVMGRITLALVVALVCVTPALGSDIGRKQQIDTKISSLQDRLAAQKQQEQALRGEVDGYTSRIRSLEARVGDVSLRLATLESDLSLHQRRLDALNALFGLQTKRLDFLKQQYATSVETLEPAARRHLRVRARVDARRRARRAFDPGRARPGAVPERDRRAGSADRGPGALREAPGHGCAREDEEAARDGPGRDGGHLRARRPDARREGRARRRGERSLDDEGAEAHRPVEADGRRAGGGGRDRRAAGGVERHRGADSRRAGAVSTSTPSVAPG